MPLRALVRTLLACVAIIVGLSIGARAAFAWVELTISNDDVRVAIDPDGRARVEHKLTLLVSGGPLREVTLQGVDADATPTSDGYVVLEKDATKKGLDGALPITTERVSTATPDGGQRADLKVVLAPGEGIKRGAYVLLVRYTTDLRATGALIDDGATSVVRWTGPAFQDGLDATKASFELPAAPTEPRVVEAKEDADDPLDVGTVLSTLHRDGKVDVLDLARPYAAKGERVVWSMRVDARAFGKERPGAVEPKPAEPSRLRSKLFGNPRDGLFLGGGLALFALFSLLVAAKTFEVRKLAAERAGRDAPLVPLPYPVRSIGAGLALVGGLYVEATHQDSLAGALLVALSALLAAQRAPRAKPVLRGPGRWLSVTVSEALRDVPSRGGASLDATTARGFTILALLLAGVGALSAWLWPVSRYYAVLVALDATPLVAIFLTGRQDQLEPDPAAAPVAFFRKVAARVQKAQPEARIVPRVRIPEGSADADELRLALLPPRPARGLFAVEIAVTYASGIGGYVMQPEILVRYQTRSEAESRAAALAQHGRATRGRKPEEAVVSLTPKLPTARMTADLAVAVLRSLTTKDAAGAPSARAEKAAPRDRRIAA